MLLMKLFALGLLLWNGSGLALYAIKYRKVHFDYLAVVLFMILYLTLG